MPASPPYPLVRPTRAAATRRQFLALLGVTGLLAGCSTQPAAPAAPATRTVVHPLGTTQVPAAPSRVVALDRRSTLPHLVALEVTPVGALTHRGVTGTDFPAVLDGSLDGVAVVDATDGFDVPDLEDVAALRPDLLLGWTDGIADLYEPLTAIAPTVALDIDFGDAAVSLRAIAAALGREPEAEAIVAAFDERLAEGGAAIADPGPVTVLLGIGDAQFRVYQPDGIALCRWLTGFGGTIVPDPATLPGEPFENLFVTISPENLGLLDSPTIALMQNTGEAGEAAVREIEASPLWPTLPAVHAGRLRLDSQSANAQFGFQGYDVVLDGLVAQWPGPA